MNQGEAAIIMTSEELLKEAAMLRERISADRRYLHMHP